MVVGELIAVVIRTVAGEDKGGTLYVWLLAICLLGLGVITLTLITAQGPSRPFADRLGGFGLGLLIVGPVLGGVLGEVGRLSGHIFDWMFGANLCGWLNASVGEQADAWWINLFGSQITLNLVGGSYPVHLDVSGEKNWMMIGGAVLGAVTMGVYGWMTDREGFQQLRRVALSVTMGACVAVLSGLILRGITGLVAWPFGWSIGSWFAWMKWSAIIGVIGGYAEACEENDRGSTKSGR
jgi:hypothetical protein